MSNNLTVSPTVYKQITNYVVKNSPTILTGLGVSGLVTTVIMAVTATPLAMEALYHESEFRKEELGESGDLEVIDKVKTVWKIYLPTTLMGITTIACIIGANRISLRRQAALLSLYSVADQTFREYQSRVVKKLGERKEDEIHGDVAQSKLEKNPITESTVIFSNGDTLCLDVNSGRYFRIDPEKLRQLQNNINKQVFSDMFVPLNELYAELQLPSIPLGDDVGWSVEHFLEFRFSARLANNNQPIIVLDYKVYPRNY